MRAGNCGRVESCAPNGKWITSFAAIVAPQTCTLVRGALVLITPARPASSLACFGLLACPSIQSFTSVVFMLIFPENCHLRFGPRLDKSSVDYPSGWRWYGLSTNPTLERPTINF